MTEAKKNHDCPLCEGTGKVTAHVAGCKVELRDREHYNARMRAVNERARARRKKLKKKA
jgi:hypothetical protein